mgnify:CR=1 FL=1
MDLHDVNCFVGRWPTESLGCSTIPDLQREMDRLGIGRALVRHTWGWWHDPAEANVVLRSQLADIEHLRPCLAATPLMEEEFGGIDAFLRGLQQAAAASVCLYPRSQSFSLSPASIGQLMEALQAVRMPLLLEMEEVSWADIDSLATNWPRLPIVLVRTGYRLMRQLLPLLRSHASLFVDTAYLADNQALECIAGSVGPERILFGTGTPRTDGSGSVARLAYSDLSDEQRELVASGNLDRLLAGICW